jgi:hypothetical protein
MRCRLLGSFTSENTLACLLATPQRERRERNQPIRQDGKGLPARMADPTADPNALVFVIVRLSESPSVADDGLAVAKRA